jgi:hypothetical protein
MGHTIRELAAAAAWAEACSSSATREVRSSFSADKGVPDVCELSDTELSDGDSRPVFKTACLGGGAGGGGGARFLPLPSTLPPPNCLRAAMAIAFVGTTPYPADVSRVRSLAVLLVSFKVVDRVVSW